MPAADHTYQPWSAIAREPGPEPRRWACMCRACRAERKEGERAS